MTPEAIDASKPAPLFRCKVLKPPRYIVPPQERIVTHPPIDVVAGVIRRDDGRLLITQRQPDDTLGGYWEFPGGKVDPGEDLKAALHRELVEDVRIVSGEPQKIEVADFRWVTLDEIMQYQFPEADLPLLNQLRGAS